MSRLVASLLLLTLLVGPARAGFEEDLTYQGHSLEKWIADLGNRDPEKRLRASRILRHVGPEADGAVAALLRASKSDDLTVRARVAACLARIGPRHVPSFAVALGLDDGGLREAAIRSLSALGSQADYAAPHLRRNLKSARSREAILNALALWRIERSELAVPLLRKQLSSGIDDQVWAAWALGYLGPAARPAAPDLVARLDHQHDVVRKYSFQALEAIGPDAVPPLVKALSSDKLRLRIEAAQALGRIGPDAEAAVPALAAASEGGSAGVRAAIARALGRIGSADEKSLAALVKLLRDSERDVRVEAALALRQLGARAAPAVADLCLSLRDSDQAVRRAASESLHSIGKPAHEPLIKLLGDSDDLVRRQALEVLRDLSPGEALAPIQAIARDAKDPLRVRAIRSLAGFGKLAVEALIGLLGDAAVRAEAAAALADLGRTASPARKALTEALAHKETRFRRELLRALMAMGEDANDSVPAMVKLFDEDQESRPTLLATFARLPGSAKLWLTAARTALKDERPLVRLQALSALVSAGTEAKPALADIEARLKDDNASVRQSAGQVLVLLGEGKPVLAAVKSMLASKDEETRRAGLELLAWMGPTAKELQVAARQLLENDSPQTQLLASAALLEIDSGDDNAVSTLISLAEKRPRLSVLRVLARCGSAGKDAVAALIAILEKEGDLALQLEAARTLGAIGPDAKEAVLPLMDLLLELERMPDFQEMEVRDLIELRKTKDIVLPRGRGLHEADVAARMEEVLEAIRTDELESIDRLAPVLREARDLGQREVLEALAAIGDGIVADVSKQLTAELDERRKLAARVLARLGPLAKQSQAALKQATKDGNRGVAVEAAIALHAVSGDSADVVPVLRENLATLGEPAVRAASGLASLKGKAKPALAELLIASRSREATLRQEAVRALGVCGGDLAQVRLALERRLRDRVWTVRVAAALALAGLVEYDAVAVLLEAVRQADDPLAREQAIVALRERKANLPRATLSSLLANRSPGLRAAALSESSEGEGLLEVAMTSAVRLSVRVEALRGLGSSPQGRAARAAVADLAHDTRTPHRLREVAREVLAKWK